VTRQVEVDQADLVGRELLAVLAKVVQARDVADGLVVGRTDELHLFGELVLAVLEHLVAEDRQE